MMNPKDSVSRIRGIMTLAALLAGWTAGVWAAAPYPFDDEDYLGAAALMPDWAATMVRQTSQSTALDACLANKEACPSYYRGLRQLLLKAEALPPERQIRLVNYYVNRKRYRDDRTARIDTPLSDEPQRYRSRWSTVEEFMRRGGDCEDFATTKYYLLRQLGFPVEQLRIVVTWDRDARGYHAVLAVRETDGDVLLLESDNLIRRGRNHPYRFIYSVNEHSVWDHQPQAARSRPTQPQQEQPA